MAEILVVDDDRDVAQSIELALRRQGFRVTVANSGVEALKLLRHHRPSLVLLDVIMPGMSGMTLVKRVKELFPDLPVLVISAYGTVDGAVAAMKQGAVDYISKPFSVAKLHQAVVKALKGHRNGGKAESFAFSCDSRDGH